MTTIEPTTSAPTHEYRMRRRDAMRLLLSAAVLPPVIGAFASPAGAHPREPRTPGAPLGDALRRLDKPELEVVALETIENERYRITFSQATWEGGSTIVRDIEVKVDGTWLPATSVDRHFEEQWVVFTGTTPDDSTYYYDGLGVHWVSFERCAQVGERTVELRASDEPYDLVVRWTLDGESPEIQYTVTAHRDDHVIVGYQSGENSDLAAVDEVLCGALQHSRVVNNDYAPKAAWEMFAPMSLVQRTQEGRPLTLGLYIPAEVLEFQHERHLGGDLQPWSLALRNDDLEISPAAYAPHVGPGTAMAAGESRGFAFGICVHVGTLYSAYGELLRSEYGYRSYRSNVYDTSLTDTVHNIAELVTTGPDGDDSVDFVPSSSGWWGRAKGYIDVENQDAARTAVAGVLLSAHYLMDTATGETPLRARARELIEYNLSRPTTGYVPLVGGTTYGAEAYRLGGITFDSVTLTGIDQLTRGQNAGVRALAIEHALAGRSGAYRAPFGVALALYQLTGDPSWLRQATEVARWYIADEIERGYETNSGEGGFAIGYSRYWIDLFMLYELTGDREFLDGAHREVQRFVTQVEVRPVPTGTITVPIEPIVKQQYDWEPTILPEQSITDLVPEEVPAWYVSTTGLTFEQLSTFKIGTSTGTTTGGGFVFNPCWAPTLLRLAHHAEDDLLADIARNMVVGRFTNYPGYYSRQFQVAQMKPDFPYTGPFWAAGIYFHHAPGQLALALDLLFSEHEVRSNGQVAFPRAFEPTFVYFKYGMYGHEPGTFYGEEGVWPYLPRGLITTSNPQVDWLAGTGNHALYLSLSNASDRSQTVRIDLANELTGIKPSDRPRTVEVIAADGSRRSRKTAGGGTVVSVPAHGHLALVVRDVEISTPWQRAHLPADGTRLSFHAEDSDAGHTQGMLLVRPDGSGYDAFIYVDSIEQATLRYRIGDGAQQEIADKPYPNEWTIGVDDLGQPITYSILTPEGTTAEVTLRLPAHLLGGAAGPSVRLEVPATTTSGETLEARGVVSNPTDDPLPDLSLTLLAPSGWTVTPGAADTEVPAHGEAAAAFTITVPTDAVPGALELGGNAAWEGGTAEIEPTPVTVRDARVMLGLRCEPRVLAEPTDTCDVTVSIHNAGATAVTDTLSLGGQPGWVIPERSVSVTVAPGEVLRHTWTTTPSAATTYGGSYQFRARWGSELSVITQARVRDAGIIVHNGLGAPAYTETGDWFRSSLTGWNDIRSRYSAEGIVGGTATWTVELPAAGEYSVAVWYPSNADTTTSAAYLIDHTGGTAEVVISQRSNPNSWRSLGSYTFDAGPARVTLEVRNPAFHRTSAVRFLPLSD